MDNVANTAVELTEASSERERSTIEFPYTDLDNAVEVVKGIHHAGGTACDYDQLAAQLKLEAKGGGFRLRVNGAKTFGLISYERGGRISLTELGRQLTDPQQERAARAAAFLSVPLYQLAYEQFKGSPLPPQQGLERAIEALGVGPKVKDRARQVMLRAAKQAGFFEAAQDRLVKPHIKNNASSDQPINAREASKELSPNQAPLGVDTGELVGHNHPLVKGLLMTLPTPGSDWQSQERVNWLVMANSIFTMIYKGEQSTIKIEIAKGGTTSVT